MTPKTVGLIVFEKMSAADLMETAEAFSRAKLPITDGHESRCYQPLTLGIGGAPCVTECGVVITPRLDFRDAPPLETVERGYGQLVDRLRALGAKVEKVGTAD